MITILMSFFVVMFSMAGTKDPKKEDPVMSSLQRQFGRYPGMSATQYVPAGSSVAGKNAPRGPAGAKESHVRGLVGDHLRVSTIRPGDQATIGCVIYFDGDSSSLNDDQRRDLRATAKELSGKPQKIEPRGHTAAYSGAWGAKNQDLWDLAYGRSRKTMQYLLTLGISPQRMRISVAAQYEPLYVGRDPLLLAKNSRVEVIMLNEYVDDMHESEEDAPTGQK